MALSFFPTKWVAGHTRLFVVVAIRPLVTTQPCYSPQQHAQLLERQAWAAVQLQPLLQNTQRLSSALLSLNLLKLLPKSTPSFPMSPTQSKQTRRSTHSWITLPCLCRNGTKPSKDYLPNWKVPARRGRLIPRSQKIFSVCYRRMDVSEKLRVLLRASMSSWPNTRASSPSPSLRHHRWQETLSPVWKQPWSNRRLLRPQKCSKSPTKFVDFIIILTFVHNKRVPTYDRSTPPSWEGLSSTLVIRLSISVFNLESPSLTLFWHVLLLPYSFLV